MEVFTKHRMHYKSVFTYAVIVQVFIVTLILLWYLDIKHFVTYIFYPTKSESLNLWQSVRLDPPHILDRVNQSRRRHGKPLNLYFQTGSKFTHLNYEIPPLKQLPLSANCSAMIRLGKHGNFTTVKYTASVALMKSREKELESRLSDCPNFVKDMGYVTDSLTDVEKEFPIAYSILVFKDFVQVEMLLRAIYRPQNFYCIHVDLKVNNEYRSKIEKLANCFENVFLTSRSVNVIWGGYTNLEPEIICMEDLWDKSVKWKYWINLTGQEFPLRTNYELVKILKSFNGANNVEGGVIHIIPARMAESGYPPYNLKPVMGSIHVILSRQFVDYVLHNKTARGLLDWSRAVKHPDEIFFNTLNFNPSLRAPGSYRGKNETTPVRNPFLARFKNWFREWRCHGIPVRYICIFSVGDLPLLATREELFANKFHFNYSPETLYCMEELIYNRTVEEYRGILGFDVSYYGTRDFVKYQF